MPATLARRRPARRWLGSKPSPGFRVDPSAPLANGLAGYWPLNEGGGLTAFDSGPLADHGAVASSNASWAQSPEGPALSFPASTTANTNVVTLGNGFAATTAGFSVAARFRADSTLGSTWQMIVGKGTPFSTWNWMLLYNTTDLRFYCGGVFAAWTGLGKSAWHTAVGTWDGATVRLYVDGLLASTTASLTTTPTNTTVYLGIGRGGGTTGTGYNSSDPFGGLIAGAAVWNRALTQPETADLSRSFYAPVLVPPSRRLFVPAAAGGNFTGASAGGLVLGGSAGPTAAALETSAGGAVLGGSAAPTAALAGSSAGGVVLGGVALATAAVLGSSAGGAVLGGTAPGSTGNLFTGSSSGGLVVGGVALAAAAALETSAGGLVLGGSAAPRGAVLAASSGGAVLGGTASGSASGNFTGSSAGGLVVGGVVSAFIAGVATHTFFLSTGQAVRPTSPTLSGPDPSKSTGFGA